MQLDGIHHITCITADAPGNVDFYARVLGLRLVKKTVNFDAPDVYHLYYGDERGAPGSILTFFGLIHAEDLGIGQSPVVALSYLGIAGMLYGFAKFAHVAPAEPSEMEHDHLSVSAAAAE